MNQFYVPKRIMAIAAHPDDIEFSAAGAIAKWILNGSTASYILCTSGEVGIAENGVTLEKARSIREQESLKAAKIIGVDEVIFLREPDGLLEANLQLRKKLVREIRRFKPELVICTDPTVYFTKHNTINHPDHRAAGLAAIDACFPAAGQPHLFQELEKEGFYSHKPRKVYVTGWHQQELSVDIEDTIDLKIKALQAHESQTRHFNTEEYIKTRSAEAAAGKEMKYAEPYRVITLMDDEKWESYQAANGY